MLIRFLVGNAYASGGTIRTTLNMANALAERHDVEVVSVVRRRQKPTFHVDRRVRIRPLTDVWSASKAKGPAVLRARVDQALAARPSKVIHPQDVRYDILFNRLTDRRLIRFLRSTRDGVLVSTRPGLNLAVAQHARDSVVRVGQEHVSLQRHRPDLHAAIAKWYPRLDAVSSLTPADAQAYRELLGEATPVYVMPNAVPDMRGARASLDHKVIIGAGRMTHLKGFDRLIAAFAIVSRKHPDWELRIFGKGQTLPDHERQIDELGLAGRARMMGFTNRLAEEMAAASVFVLSSRFEGFSMVIVEAMACGLPVVSFDCRHGPRELIQDGVDGLLAPNGDVDALADRIIALIEDPDRRRRLAQAGLAKAEQFSTPGLARRWEEIFAGLANARGIAL